MQKGKSLPDIAKVLTMNGTIEYQRHEHYHTHLDAETADTGE